MVFGETLYSIMNEERMPDWTPGDPVTQACPHHSPPSKKRTTIQTLISYLANTDFPDDTPGVCHPCLEHRAVGLDAALSMALEQVQKSKVLICAARPGEALLQLMLKLHSVGKLSERIGSRQVPYSLFGPLSFGNVLGRINPSLQLSAIVS